MTDLPDAIGKFRIDGLLGEGGMGVVYRAWDPTLERPAAIKVIHAHLCQGPLGEQILARFRNEAIAAARLSHPNVVPVYEFGEHGGSPFIAMAFIEGRELGNRLKAGERLTVEETVHIVTQVLHGLGYCHAHGIVHRDLKPANILVQSDGCVKITDFGIARLESSDLTQTGAVMGTMSYMSPEQHLGQVVDHRSDLFSVGVILYELLTNERPFAGRTNAMILHNVMNSNVVDPSQVNVHVTPSLTPVVHKALATQPGDRFQSAQEFAETLQQAVPQNAHTALQQSQPDSGRGIQGPGSPTPSGGLASGLVRQPADLSLGDDDSTIVSENGLRDTPVESSATAVLVDQDTPTEVFDPPTAAETQRRRSMGPATIGLGAAIALVAIAGWWWSSRPATTDEPALSAAPAEASREDAAPEPVTPASPVATDQPSEPATARIDQPVLTANDPTQASSSDGSPRADADDVKMVVDRAAESPSPASGGETDTLGTSSTTTGSTVNITTTPLGGGFPNAMVRVNSIPSGAIFMLNGEPIGVTPLEVEVVPGSYEFSIRKARHRPVKHQVAIERGSRLDVSSVLLPKE